MPWYHQGLDSDLAQALYKLKINSGMVLYLDTGPARPDPIWCVTKYGIARPDPICICDTIYEDLTPSMLPSMLLFYYPYAFTLLIAEINLPTSDPITPPINIMINA